MLILTRKSNQSVVIGDNIEIKVLEVRGDQISLGFSAPKDISIYRKEVYENIQNENIQAASKGDHAIREVTDSLGQHILRVKKSDND